MTTKIENSTGYPKTEGKYSRRDKIRRGIQNSLKTV